MARFVLPIESLVLALALIAVGPIEAQQAKPNLYLVCVGVSKFEHKPFERGVMYAAKDAKDVAALFRAQQGKMFGKIECRLLVDPAATRAKVADALAWLKEKATSDSLVVVFFAGHGGPDAIGEYEFLPHDAKPFLHSSSISGRLLRAALKDLPGKTLVLLDTCHAGGFGGKGAGFSTLASCSAMQVSGEMLSKEGGCFTQVLLDALAGRADANGDGMVTLAEAAGFAKTNLARLTAGRQSVTINHPASGSAELALVNVTALQPVAGLASRE